MLIDNIDINSFGAELVEKKIKTANIEVKYDWLDKAYSPLFFSRQNKFTPIECKFTVKAENKQNLAEKVSHFLKKLEVCTLKFDDLEFYYKVFLDTKINEYFGVDEKDGMEVESVYVMLMSAYKFKNETIETMNRITTKTINVPGNTETPCIVEITPSVSIIDIVLTGLDDEPIIVKNLTGGKKVIVNGEDGTVTVDGVNKYGDTDMWEFPRLKPGANTIKVSKSNVDINIKYKGRWI